MADAAFNFTQSLLFADSGGLDPAAESGVPESLPFELFSQPLTFEDPPPSGLETQTRDLDATEGAKPKKAILFDGSTVTLRPRTRTAPVVSFDDADTILDMDVLHERVARRQSSKEAAQTRLEQKTKSLQPQAAARQVWTDKYKPRSFLELVPGGNERQYRQILWFLRKWNSVLQRQPVVEDTNGVDSLGRPLKKVLLVHGPSGCGKTTAVHILAHQMGYAVQELNAANSMDTVAGTDAERGTRFANAAAALKLRIQNAMTSNTLDLGTRSAPGGKDDNGGKENDSDTIRSAAAGATTEPRPTCLVIDEIDSSINAGDIVRVINEVVASDGRRRRKGRPFVLRRPIICIANDIYTHVRGGANPMERLRPLCEMVQFRRPTASRRGGVNLAAQLSVREFLGKVSRAERLGLDARAVADVLEACEGDVRACLNYLQFAGRLLGGPGESGGSGGTAGTTSRSPSSVSGLNGAVARKDDAMSWYAMVDALFTRDAALLKEVQAVAVLDMMLADSTAPLDKIVRGCFNRYLDAEHLQHDTLAHPADMADWLYYYDVAPPGDYAAVAAVKFWSVFSAIRRRRADENSLLPQARSMDFEAYELLQQNRTAVRRVTDLLPLQVQLACGAHHALDLVPFLDAMLSPPVGSARAKVALSRHEQTTVDKLAQLVAALGLTLESTRDFETNQISLAFSPSWDSLTTYECSAAPQPVATRARALNAKRQWLFPLLQAELDAAAAHGVKRQLDAVDKTDAAGTRPAQKRRGVLSVDYFRAQYGATQTEQPRAAPVSRMWVKYHEGFSNAVRKNIGWRDLWVE